MYAPPSTVLVVCVLLTALTALDVSRAGAQRPSRDASAQLDRFIAEYAERLGLDQETLATIRTIVDASRAQGETLRTELRQAQAQMRALLSQEVPNEAAVMQQADAIGALELAVRKQRLQVDVADSGPVDASATAGVDAAPGDMAHAPEARYHAGMPGREHGSLSRCCPGASTPRMPVRPHGRTL